MLPLHHLCIWSQRRDLNSHIPGYEPGTLPLSYAAIPEVRVGFEPTINISFAD